MAAFVLLCGRMLDLSERTVSPGPDFPTVDLRNALAAGHGRGRADIVALPGGPIADIGATAQVDFVMKFRRQSRRWAGWTCW